MPAGARIFLSYARTDGRGLAASLAERLSAADLTLWQDLTSMEGGRDWWEQVRTAIERVEYLVLIITPNALKSDYVAKEWRYARQMGVCVIPVFEGAEPDFGSLPQRWMRETHFINLAIREQWNVFINQLQRHCEVKRVPFMAEDLPGDYIERHEELHELKAVLLDENVQGPVGLVAVKGGGGYGKTTLAKALCHDQDIQQRFHDGILWVSLGREPGDLTPRIVGLIEILTGERLGFPDMTTAAARLAELLSDQDVLLVIDDLWNEAHARPFLRGGRHCVRLITTRDAATLPTQTRTRRVDAMQAQEAMQLLAANLPMAEVDSCANHLERLAARLGEWPLLLKLVNGILVRRTSQSNQPLSEAIAFANRRFDTKGLAAFDPQAVSEALAVSIEQLTPEERDRFAELAIFPEDTSIPLAVVECLWSAVAGIRDADEIEQLCQRLFELSLLFSLDFRTRELRLHDVVRSYLRKKHEKQLANWNWALLQQGLPEQQVYGWLYRVYHLHEANRIQDISELLFDFSWLSRKLDATDVNALILDYEYLAGSAAAKAVQSAIRLSAHILGTDKKQLAPHLVGRLADEPWPEISKLLEHVRLTRGARWLCPQSATLTRPGGFLLRTLAGHADWITAVALTPDARCAISGSYDRTLKLWNLQSGTELMTLSGHSGLISAVAVTPRGFVVSGSCDGALVLWDLKSGALLRSLAGHSDGITAVAVGCNGMRAISGSHDGTLRLWDLESGAELKVMTGHKGFVSAVAITQDGRFALTGSDDRRVCLWDLGIGTPIRYLSGHSALVSGVAFANYSRYAISSSHDQSVRVWDLKSGEAIWALAGHTREVSAISVTAAGRFVSASWDQTLKMWDFETGTEKRTLAGHTREVNAVVVSPDGRFAVSGSDDHTLKLWSLEGSEPEPRTLRHNRRVRSLAFVPNRPHVISGTDDRSLRIWNFETGMEVSALVGHLQPILAVAVTADGRRAVTASSDATLKVWDLQSGEVISTLAGHTDPVMAVALTPDGRRAVSASADTTLKLWDLETSDELCTLSGHQNRVSAVTVSDDGTRAISGSYDQTIRVWDLESGTELRTIAGHRGKLTAIAVVPGKDRVISAAYDSTLRIWDVNDGCQVRVLSGHRAVVNAIAVAPDSCRAVSAGSDQLVGLWDLEHGTILADFKCDSEVMACAIAPDGAMVVAGEASGRIHFLRLTE
jgi:WD40 repeat protein